MRRLPISEKPRYFKTSYFLFAFHAQPGYGRGKSCTHHWNLVFRKKLNLYMVPKSHLAPQPQSNKIQMLNAHSHNDNNNNNNARTMFMLLSSWPIATARVHPVHLTNVGQRRAAADPPTKPTDLGIERNLYRLLYDLHPPSPFIFTQPEGWYSFYRPTEGERLSQPRHTALYNII